ncbi:MAG: MFS transporter [Saezia sp.]
MIPLTSDSEYRLTYGVTWLIGFFAFLNVYPIQTVLPLIQTELNISKSTTGLLVGITLFAVALLSPFMGLISDRIGRKNIICVSLVGVALPSVFIPLADSLYSLLFLRFVQGISLPGIIVVSMAYIAEEIPSTSIAKATTAYVSGTVVGGFIGRFIVGHTANLTGEWRNGFFILGMLSAVGIAAIIKLAPRSRHFVPSPNIRQGLQLLSAHLKNKKILSACGIGFCSLFSITSGFTYIPYLLHQEPFNLSAAIIANIFAVYLIGATITPLSSRMIDFLGKQRAILLAITLSILGICLTLIPSLPWIIVGMACFASGIFICQAIAIVFIATHIQFGRSLATGLYNMSYYIGGALGSWFSGITNEYYHWPGTVANIVFVLLISSLIAQFFWKQKNS